MMTMLMSATGGTILGFFVALCLWQKQRRQAIRREHLKLCEKLAGHSMAIRRSPLNWRSDFAPGLMARAKAAMDAPGLSILHRRSFIDLNPSRGTAFTSTLSSGRAWKAGEKATAVRDWKPVTLREMGWRP